MKRFGLVGYPLSHSYSKDFFTKKFAHLGLKDHIYQFFELVDMDAFPDLWTKHIDLVGVNITVPYKEKVISYLDEMDMSASGVGAVNVVFRHKNKLKGYNTDFMAFRESLLNWIGSDFGEKAMVLGNGGAAKAVRAGLDDLSIPSIQISRSAKRGDYTYSDLEKNLDIMREVKLIINTTPIGMYPNIDAQPKIPYHRIDKEYYLYDLVYNPSETSFMRQGLLRGAKTKNGYQMLVLQAEKSWEIWNS